MLGRLEFVPGGRGQVEPGQLYGLPVLRARVDPETWLKQWRMKKAARQLRGLGTVHTLLPPGFEDEKWLACVGLRRVDCSPFLQAQAPGLAIEALHRRDVEPGRACVALRGNRVDGHMTRVAAQLSRQVRHLAIDVPRGGEKLERWLRWEFGIAILPNTKSAQLSLQFHPRANTQEGAVLELYGHKPNLDGLTLCAPCLARGEQEDLELLSVLWARGRLGEEALKFT